MKNGVEMFVVDKKMGKKIYLDKDVKKNIDRKEVLEMLRRKIGIRDRGREMNVIEDVEKCYIDNKNGKVLDKKKRKKIKLDEDVRSRMIYNEGDDLLGRIIDIKVKKKNVKKKIKS